VVPRPGVEPGRAGFAGPLETVSRGVGPGRWTRTTDRRHIRPPLWLLSYPRDGGVAGYRSRDAGFMGPRRRLGATHVGGKAGRIRTGVAWLRATHPAARRQPRGGSGEIRTPNLLLARQPLCPVELRTRGALGRTCTPTARFKRPASGSLSYEGVTSVADVVIAPASVESGLCACSTS
jgi:hypothetical protein